MNLLQETLEELEYNGKTMDDIISIQGDEFAITREKFIQLADVEYDGGFGAQEVAEDLKLVGEGFWLERHEYDGSECWIYKEQVKPLDNINHDVKRLTVVGTDMIGWTSLSGLNED